MNYYRILDDDIYGYHEEYIDCRIHAESGKTFFKVYNQYYGHNECEQVKIGSNCYPDVHSSKPWLESPFFLFRVSNEGIYVRETHTSQEILLIPSKPEKGYVAVGNHWRIEITSNNAKLKTPTSKYSNLLSIRFTSLSNSAHIFTEYYERNTGKVAVTKGDQLVMYLLNTMSQEGMRLVNKQLYLGDDRNLAANPHRHKIDSLRKLSQNNVKTSYTIIDDCCTLFLDQEGGESIKLTDLLHRVRDEIGTDFTITFWVFINWDGSLYRVDILDTDLSDEHIEYLSQAFDWSNIRGGPCTVYGFPKGMGPTYRYLVRDPDKNNVK